MTAPKATKSIVLMRASVQKIDGKTYGTHVAPARGFLRAANIAALLDVPKMAAWVRVGHKAGTLLLAFYPPGDMPLPDGYDDLGTARLTTDHRTDAFSIYLPSSIKDRLNLSFPDGHFPAVLSLAPGQRGGKAAHLLIEMAKEKRRT